MSPHWAEEDGAVEHPTLDGPEERFFVSPTQGLILVETDLSVWECDLAGYRITEVPTDAVEWRPVDMNTPSCGVCTDAGRYLNINDSCPVHGEEALVEED